MNQETNEMLEIYCNTNLRELAPEEIRLLKKDLEERKKQLDVELENLYENNKISDSGKISMMETMMTELDDLLEEISEILQVPIQETEELLKVEPEETEMEDIEQPETKEIELVSEEIEEEEFQEEEIIEHSDIGIQEETVEVATIMEELPKTTIQLSKPSEEYIKKVAQNRQNEKTQYGLLEAVAEGEKVANALMEKLQILEKNNVTEPEPKHKQKRKKEKVG